MSGWWKNALLKLFDEPEAFDIIYENKFLWVINDKFPKAKFHALIVPKIKLVRGIADLRREHIPLLMEMVTAATNLTKLPCLIGFHRHPSLNQLHLHVVSTDLSKAKTSKHRESFKPENMVSVEEVVESVEKLGKIGEMEKSGGAELSSRK